MYTLPKWAKFVKDKYKSNVSNAFILTGNIGDYVAGRKYFRDYLVGNFLTHENNMNMDNIYFYDINTGGLCVSGNGKGTALDWNELMKNMNECNPSKRNAYVFFYPQFIIPASQYLQPDEQQRVVALHSILNSSKFVSSNNIVFIVADTANDINPLFLGNNSKTTLFNLELPDKEDRYNFIKSILSEQRINMMLSVEEMANLTAGLQLIAIEDILLIGSDIGKVTSKMVMERKKEVIQKEFGEIIEIFETEGYSLKDFAGQEEIKKYFKDVIIDAVRENEIDIIPKGVMLMGPPGTGKTYFSRCLAGDAGINFVEFKMSKILGKYVGESEKSMEKALSVFRALAPVGVFMDEIDQSMSRGQGGSDGGSQVNANLFGMLLAEMSKPENRGKIIWLAATNYPNNVDEALKRTGRFDKKIPFFAPTEKERILTFNLHLNKAIKKGFTVKDINTAELAKRTNKYTQAEIEGIVVKALELCRRERSKTITQEHLLKALEYMMSTQNSKITEMEDIALKECNDQEFIPIEYRERHKKLMSNNVDFGEVDRATNTR